MTGTSAVRPRVRASLVGLLALGLPITLPITLIVGCNRVPPNDRARLEHLCRYLLRPPAMGPERSEIQFEVYA